MKIILIAFTIVMASFCEVHSQPTERKNSVICWQEGVKLKWCDFQAANNPLDGDNPLSSINAANAAPEISVEPVAGTDGKNDFLVRVIFNKARAWVRDTATSTPVILAHEQVHFDIAELIGRRLRLRISQARKAGKNIFSSEMGKEIEQLLEEENKLDASYDLETSHGTVAIEQKKWTLYVKAELAKLSTYKSTAATCQQ